MTAYIIRSFVVFVFLLSPLFSQEIIDQFAFKIKVETKETTQWDSKVKSNTIINYFDFTDPSKAGKYKLPLKSIILAIPPNSDPVAKVVNYKQTELDNAIPATQPEVKLQNDSTLVYKTVENIAVATRENNKPIVELVKKFWFRDFYCVEVILNTHQFDPSRNTIIIYDEIDIELAFDSQYSFKVSAPLEIKSEYDHSLKSIIYNHEIAEQFRSVSPKLQLSASDSWINYSQNYVKISVAQDAIFHLTFSDLADLGIPVNTIDPRTFQLFDSGNEQPIFVEGEADGSFNVSDFILFWGEKNYSENDHRAINADNEPYNSFLNIYTDSSTYFLTWGTGEGKRFTQETDSPVGSFDELNYHTSFVHIEQNTMFQNLNNNEVANQTSDWNKNKTWYWGWIFESTRNFNVNLEELYPSEDARVYFKLTSAGSNISTNAHQVAMRFNNTKIDSQNINRFDQAILTGTVDTGKLNQGNNTLTVQNYANGTLPNFLAYDWFEIEYPRKNSLVNDSLIITVPEGFSNQVVELKFINATINQFEIFKVAGGFKKIENHSFESNGISFIDTVSAGDKYVLIASNRLAKPSIKYLGQFENIRSDHSQADYIAITPKKFSAEVDNYLSEIEQLFDIKTKKLFTEDIYNEFGNGYPTAESIKEFVQYAYNNWSNPKPAYLVLFGDANYDYKDYVVENVGVKLSQNHIPAFGNPVSDNWYAIWGDGPYIPQLKVGRIPMQSESDLDYYLSKIQNNENSEFDEWNKRYILFSGGVGSNPNELRQLKTPNDTLISKVIEPRPLSGNYTHFYKTVNPTSDFGPYTPGQVTNTIENGSIVISYMGHSGTATWDNSINEVSQLKNKVNRNPVISDFGCSTNKYAEPDIVCFGERFLFSSDGQALNYIGNSSLGFTSTAFAVPEYFYESLLLDSLNEVGAAHIHAKSRLYEIFGNSAVYNVFALSNIVLGDPAVRVKVPDRPNIVLNSQSLEIESAELNDVSDSIALPLFVYNQGSAELQNYDLTYKQYFENSLIKSKTISSRLPGYKDSLTIWLDTKNLAGEHRVEIIADPDNKIVELNEDDNTSIKMFNVYSSSFNDLLVYEISNGILNKLRIMNSLVPTDQSFGILTELSEEENFADPIQLESQLGTLITDLEMPSLKNRRYWVRYKLNDPQFEFSSTKSFFNNSRDFYVNDTHSLATQELTGVQYTSQEIILAPDTLNISVLSSGWYAGATCVIAENGINLLDNSFFAGMGIVVFDDVTMEVDTATWFQLFDNRPNALALAELINNIPEGKIVVMGVSDDGQHRLISELRTAIKTLGSEVIDQLQFRGSWAIIGRKGASPGDPDIIEEVRGPYDGSVYLEKEYIVPNQTGYLTTERLGPVSSWDTLYVNHEIPEGASIDVIPIGIRKNQQEDTLSTFALNLQYTPLSFINPNTYPYSKLRFKFTQNDQAKSPTISEIGVSHHNAPELAINYQVASISKDTVIQGEPVTVNFRASNVGEGRALNVRTKVDLYKDNMISETVFDSTLSFLNKDDYKELTFDHVTSLEDELGNYSFRIILDADDNSIELYEDNNEYELPFTLIEDTVTSVSTAIVSASFDGYEIYDGDYVSDEPEIKVNLDYQGQYSITDSGSISVLLNQKQIPYSSMSLENDLQKRRISLSFTPKLEDGDYTLSVNGDNLRSVDEDRNGFIRFFKVSSETKILYPYNYPNPISDQTHFTFKLTQIPDELRIKIYTIAGRLVRELNLSSDQLNFDFNRIYWDGRDQDGDLLANGVYIYKIIGEHEDEKVAVTNKLAIVR